MTVEIQDRCSFASMPMSGAATLHSSFSLPSISYAGLRLQTSIEQPSQSSELHQQSLDSSDTETGRGETSRKSTNWIRHLGVIDLVFELLGITRFFSLLCFIFSKNDRQRIKSQTLLKRFLAIFWSLACLSVSIASGLFAMIQRAMLASKLLTAASLLGLNPTLQQTKDDAVSTSVLQDRLEIATLAIKHLKNEGLTLQDKLRAAGERIAKSEASQAEYANFHALEAKYTEVSAEIERLTRENKELRADGARLAKENTELRQCLAIKSPELKDEADGLGMLARLQNQRLDSCVFPISGKIGQERPNSVADESIMFVTGSDLSKKDLVGSSGLYAPAGVSSGPNSMPTNQTLRTEEIRQPSSQPIPVFTTVRPSLPPKATKLKPLLLGVRNAPGGTLRRNTIKQANRRRFGPRQQEVGNATVNPNVHSGHANDHDQTSILNPCAPTFTPRIAVDSPARLDFTPTSDGAITLNSALCDAENNPSAISSYVFSSPSPNSPFLRPPPARRQTDEASLPSFKTIPPTPTTPKPPSPLATGGVIGTSATPRTTRASSVRLIRARAAWRNTKRIISVPSAEEIPDDKVKDADLVAKGPQVQMKTRLVGKGAPPRRALGEVTNSDSNSSGRWISA